MAGVNTAPVGVNRPLESVSGQADPNITLSAYPGSDVDRLLIEGVAPLWLEFQEECGPLAAALWFMRYRRCGEHVKLRVYVDPSHATYFNEKVVKFISSILDKSRKQKQMDGPGLMGKHDPPIDEEDKAQSNYPTGRILWTHYNRSHVTFGGEPYLSDDEYVRLFSQCLVASCESVLARFSKNAGTTVPHAVRIVTLMVLIESGLRAAGLDAPALRYLEYHRDWLVRFVVLKTGGAAQQQESVLGRFDARLAENQANWQRVIRAARAWKESPPEFPNAWSIVIDRLMCYVRKLISNGAYLIDPYAPNPSFSVLFKVLHGAANQTGLSLLDEATVYQSLITTDCA